MQTRTRTLSAVTLAAAMLFATTAMAADLPKEGTFSHATYHFGTWKGTMVGKGQFLGSWDHNGLSIGNGITDHLSWHCWGLSETQNGINQGNGYCVATDPDGDQIGGTTVAEKYASNAKTFRGLATFTAGTGKYAGISGSFTYVCHGNEFKAAAEGTYLAHCDGQGSYKLP